MGRTRWSSGTSATRPAKTPHETLGEKTIYLMATTLKATTRMHQTTTATPEQFIAGLTDVGPDRSKLPKNSAYASLRVHREARSYAGEAELS